MNDYSQRLDALIDFPDDFTFRILAESRNNILTDCLELVETMLERPVKGEMVPSRKGRFCSVRLNVTVHTANEIVLVYESLHKVEGVKVLL